MNWFRRKLRQNQWIRGLQDRQWEVRLASADSLNSIGWTPRNLEEHIYYFLAIKDWPLLTELLNNMYHDSGEPNLYHPLIIQCIEAIGQTEPTIEDLSLLTTVLLEIFGLRNQYNRGIDLLELLLSQVTDPSPIVPILLDTIFAISQMERLFSFDTFEEKINRILQILNKRINPIWLISTFLTIIAEENPAYHDPGVERYSGDYEDFPPYGHFATTFLKLIGNLEEISFITVIPTLQTALHNKNPWVRVTAAMALVRRIDKVEQFDQAIPPLLEAVSRTGYPGNVNWYITNALLVLAYHIKDTLLLPQLIPALFQCLYYTKTNRYEINIREYVIDALIELALKVEDPSPVVEGLLFEYKNTDLPYPDVLVKPLFKLVEGLEDPSFLVSKLEQELAGRSPPLLVEFMDAIAKKLENPLPVAIPLFRYLNDPYWVEKELPLKWTATETLENVCWQSPDPSKLVDSIDLYFKWNFSHDFEGATGSKYRPVAWLLAVVVCRLSGIIPPVPALQRHFQALKENKSKWGNSWPEICGRILLDLDQPEAVIPTLLNLTETHPTVAPVLGIMGGLIEDSNQLERSLLRALKPNKEGEIYGNFVAWAIKTMESYLNNPSPLIQPLLRIIEEDKNYRAQGEALAILILIESQLEANDKKQVANLTRQIMEDANHTVRTYVFESLKKLEDKRAIPYLTRVINDTIFEDEAGGISNALGAIGKPAIAPLIQALTNKSSYVRESVVYALGCTKEPQAINALAQTLLTDNDVKVRWCTAETLGIYGNKTAIPALVQSLQHPNYDIRYGSAEALSSLNWSPGDTTEDVYFHIATENWEDIVELGAIAIPILIPFLQDSSFMVRKGVALTLCKLGWSPGDTTEDVYFHIATENWEDIVELGAIAIPILIPFVQNSRYEVRKGVALTLCKLGWSPEHTYDLAHYFIAKEEWETVVKLGSHAVLPLLQTLQDMNPNFLLDRIEVVKVLGKIGDKRAIKPLSKLQVNPNSDIKKVITLVLTSLAKHDSK